MPCAETRHSSAVPCCRDGASGSGHRLGLLSATGSPLLADKQFVSPGQRIYYTGQDAYRRAAAQDPDAPWDMTDAELTHVIAYLKELDTK